MRLSVAVAPKDAPDNAFVVFRGLEESIEKAAEFGYQGIELAIPDAASAGAASLSRSLSGHGMEVSAISTGLVYAASGISLLGTPEAAVPVFLELIDMAADFGRQVNIGRSRGFKKNLSPHEAADRLKRVLTPLMDHAARRNVTLLLEPVNRYEIDWINSVDEGAAVLDRIGNDCLGLMPDVFHMNIEDRFIGNSLIEHKNYVKYVHLADSNREAPGRGHLNFNEVFSALKAIEYKGWLSVEILPVPSPDKAAKQASDYLLPLLAQYKT
ncbi:MAG: sugar phosphate isomerase/epimerase [Treponema sp.]|jgi:sugar phosphate isomerase/epimerase|nr:sugar phosphate isomerase/epimerase [Treponema sp.]